MLTVKVFRPMYNFTTLRVWQASQGFFLKIHELSYHSFFERNRYQQNQLLRASLSVPLNIAEGAGRGRSKEFAYFLRIARGSLDEVVSLLFILEKLQPQVFPVEELRAEASGIRAAINALHGKISPKTAKLSNSQTSDPPNSQPRA